MSQKEPKLKVIHAFVFSRGQASIATGCLIGAWEVIGKESCGLEQIYGCLYVRFEAILDSREMKKCMGCYSEAIRGNANGVKHPRNVTSHAGLPRNVSDENMTRPDDLQKCP